MRQCAPHCTLITYYYAHVRTTYAQWLKSEMYTHNKIAMNKKTQLLKSFQGNWKVSLEAYVFRVKKKQEIVTKYFREHTLQLLGTVIWEIMKH